MANFSDKGLIDINTRWFYFSVKRIENCLFSRRNGINGIRILGYSVYFKSKIK